MCVCVWIRWVTVNIMTPMCICFLLLTCTKRRAHCPGSTGQVRETKRSAITSPCNRNTSLRDYGCPPPIECTIRETWRSAPEWRTSYRPRTRILAHQQTLYKVSAIALGPHVLPQCHIDSGDQLPNERTVAGTTRPGPNKLSRSARKLKNPYLASCFAFCPVQS